MLIKARYVLPISAPSIENGAVVVHDDMIVAVGPAAELCPAYPDEDVYDYGLAALTPGFVDTHTHLEYTALRGLVEDVPYAQWKSELMAHEAIFSARDWEDSARLGALEALASGITTLADITQTGASGRAAQEMGLRGIIYREVEGMERPLLKGIMQKALADIADWEDRFDPVRLEAGLSPHSPYSCHPELFEAVRDAAVDGRPVAMHLAGSREEYQFVKYGSSMLGFDVREQYDAQAPLWLPTGVSPVRYVDQYRIFCVPRFMAIHCTQVDEEDIDILARNQVSIAHCPRCNAKLGMGTAPVDKFLEAGLVVGLGTDSPAATNTMGMFAEMSNGLLIQRSHSTRTRRRFFSAHQYLRFATLDGARALGMDKHIGSLEPGKLADLLVVDLTHSAQVPTREPESALVHTSHRSDIILVMVGGRVLYANGDWTEQDGSAIKERVEAIRDKLRA
ncbi:MAG: amidohydrolase family protein [Actinomycetia bacterium]|nr:amidohydrolase family protein [Actinomycetes bacterium]